MPLFMPATVDGEIVLVEFNDNGHLNRAVGDKVRFKGLADTDWRDGVVEKINAKKWPITISTQPVQTHA